MAFKIARIPEQYRRGLATITALPLETVSAMAVALGRVHLENRDAELLAAVRTTAELDPEEAQAVIASLQSLYSLKASSEDDPDLDFVAAIIAAMQRTGVKNLTVEDGQKDSLRDKLTRLLSLNSLVLASKIDQLRIDRPVIFYDAKILTDLRPVYEKPGDPPIGGIVSHVLKIVSHEHGSEHKELYFALDAKDVATLKRISERAEAKASGLKTFMKAANLPDFS